MTKYTIIKGNSTNYIESELNWYSKTYKDFTVHGGLNNYEGYFSVLVSYKGV